MERKIPTNPRSVKTMMVIQTNTAVGTGTEDDPMRIVTCYWSLDGQLLAFMDPATEVPLSVGSQNYQ